MSDKYEVQWREAGAEWTEADGSPFEDVQHALGWIHQDSHEAEATAADWFRFQDAIAKYRDFTLLLRHATGPTYEYQVRRRN